MDLGTSPSSGKSTKVRGWLEAAIFHANAALPPTPPSSVRSTCAQSDVAAEVAEGTDLNDGPGTYKRKLATVRRVAAVTRVNRSHYAVTVDGWNAVTKKANKFSKGDLVLFLEVDAFLPARSGYDDLFFEVGPLITFDHEEGYRVGTSVWTGTDKTKIISQGHVFQLSHFPHIDRMICDLRFAHVDLSDHEFADLIRGIDLSADLGIKKWQSCPEPAEDINGVPTANPKVPPFIPKTDMERVQNCPNLFIKPKYRDFIFQESIKLDGASMTVYFVTPSSPLYHTLPPLPPLTPSNSHTMLPYAVHLTGRLGVCTRNQDLLPHLLPSKTAQPTHATYWTAALAANLHLTLPKLAQNIAIQAELVGAAIQRNPYGYAPNQHQLFVFAIIDLATATRWHPRRVQQFAAAHGLRHVPVLGYHTLPSVARHHQDLLDRAELKPGEGLVFKNCQDGRWFKVLSARWILEREDEAKAREMAREEGKDRGRMCRGTGKATKKNALVGVAAAEEKTAVVVENRVIGKPEDEEKHATEGKAVKENDAHDKKVVDKESINHKWQQGKEDVPAMGTVDGWPSLKGKTDNMQSSKESMATGDENAEKQDLTKWWHVSEDEARKIREILADLDEWVRRDDGLQKWMQEWRQGLHGGPQVVKLEDAEARGKAATGTRAAVNGAGKDKAHGKPPGHSAEGFGVSEEKRKMLADWLGITETGA
jgi:RNA ligase (TIGR02306 family)